LGMCDWQRRVVYVQAGTVNDDRTTRSDRLAVAADESRNMLLDLAVRYATAAITQQVVNSASYMAHNKIAVERLWAAARRVTEAAAAVALAGREAVLKSMRLSSVPCDPMGAWYAAVAEDVRMRFVCAGEDWPLPDAAASVWGAV
jgi:hypothetical protein